MAGLVIMSAAKSPYDEASLACEQHIPARCATPLEPVYAVETTTDGHKWTRIQRRRSNTGRLEIRRTVWWAMAGVFPICVHLWFCGRSVARKAALDGGGTVPPWVAFLEEEPTDI